MNRMIEGLQQLFRMVWQPPPPHPIVGEVERTTESSLAQSRKVDRQADAFAVMIRGMRGEPRRRRGKAK